MQDDLLDSCRLQRVGDKAFRGIVPKDQVDTFPIEGIDDVLDAVPPDADASTDAIDARISARHSKLASVPRFARDSPDFDGPRGDLGDFLRKEPSDHIGVVCHDRAPSVICQPARSVYPRRLAE